MNHFFIFLNSIFITINKTIDKIDILKVLLGDVDSLDELTVDVLAVVVLVGAC